MALELPTHTPYDGSSRLFTVGLKPLDLSDWLEVDRHFEAYIAEKRRLYAGIPDLVFVEEPDTAEAQREVLSLIEAHLALYGDRLFGSRERHARAREVADGDSGLAPLRRASLLVQEDLILMRRGDSGWRLAAGSLCFPSSWSLREKFGRPLQDIHVPVPGFGTGTRMAELIHRMFDNLKVEQPVQRWNWSIQAGADLYLSLSNDQRDARATTRPSKFPAGDMAARAFIRVERQTLRRLPSSGDILFTIRIHLDPLAALARHPDRAALATAFAAQVSALDVTQLDYKGLTADRDSLVELLQAIAAGVPAAETQAL